MSTSWMLPLTRRPAQMAVALYPHRRGRGVACIIRHRKRLQDGGVSRDSSTELNHQRTQLLRGIERDYICGRYCPFPNARVKWVAVQALTAASYLLAIDDTEAVCSLNRCLPGEVVKCGGAAALHWRCCF